MVQAAIKEGEAFGVDGYSESHSPLHRLPFASAVWSERESVNGSSTLVLAGSICFLIQKKRRSFV